MVPDIYQADVTSILFACDAHVTVIFHDFLFCFNLRIPHVQFVKLNIKRIRSSNDFYKQQVIIVHRDWV